MSEICEFLIKIKECCHESLKLFQLSNEKDKSKWKMRHMASIIGLPGSETENSVQHVTDSFRRILDSTNTESKLNISTKCDYTSRSESQQILEDKLNNLSLSHSQNNNELDNDHPNVASAETDIATIDVRDNEGSISSPGSNSAKMMKWMEIEFKSPAQMELVNNKSDSSHEEKSEDQENENVSNTETTRTLSIAKQKLLQYTEDELKQQYYEQIQELQLNFQQQQIQLEQEFSKLKAQCYHDAVELNKLTIYEQQQYLLLQQQYQTLQQQLYQNFVLLQGSLKRIQEEKGNIGS